jgi:ABC-2 type transport system ATP-binding protein
VLGLEDVTLTVGAEGSPRIIGLLGPNGAGKSTLMKLVAGLIRPSRGEVKLFGRRAFADLDAREKLGYCPEHEGTYDDLTAHELVTAMARLSGLPARTARERAEAALVELGLEAARDRRVHGFSKGMRQRAKLAGALVHDPELVLLDEPLTGCDPVARARIIATVKRLAAAGKAILVSSHVLYEIEALTSDIVVIFRGRVLAEGPSSEIRALVDQHPHRVHVRCDRPRQLAAMLIDASHVVRVEFHEHGLELETRAPDALYDVLPRAALDAGVRIETLESPDDSMQAVFDVLTRGAPARGASGRRPPESAP